MAKRLISTYRPSSISRAAAGAALVIVACAAGCSGTQPTSETLVSVTSALTAAQQQVLGFESPSTDWSSPTGTLGRSSTHSQGSFSTSVLNNGWTEIISKPIASLGPVSTMLTYDLRLPQAMPWGETRVIIRIPSQSIFWQDLGSVPLVSTPAGAFERITFALPPALVTALSASYTDLEIRVVINAPTSTTPFLLDNLAIAPAAPSGGGSSGSAFSFSLSTPSGLGPADVFMSTTNRLQVDDRVVLGTSSALESVANFGSAGFELGAQAVAHANVYSAGGTTFLRSQSTVRGFVRAVGTIQTQPPVTIGSPQPNTATASTPTLFTVTPPATSQPFIFLDVDQPPSGQPPRAIAPGAYAGLDVHSRSRVSLATGTYFFDSFNTEPDAQVFIDTSAGPIFIYTKTMFRFHGGFVQSAGPEGRVLVGHSGTSNVDLQVGFVGTVVAPNAQIDLRRPTTGQHRGSFFGARIEAFSDSTILHIPFDWSFLCARGDSDGDGLTDCDDACPHDPKKSQPGVCGCGVAESDTDGDGTPDCIEGCPNDPTNVACAHSNDPPNGTSGLPVTETPPSNNQGPCNSAAAFPPHVQLPIDLGQLTAAQRNAIGLDACSLINDTTLTNGVTCSANTQEPGDCPLDPNSVKDGPCIDPPQTSTRPTRDQMTAACAQRWGAGFICAPGKSPACNGPNPPAGQCDTQQFHCGTPDPACTAPEGPVTSNPPQCNTPPGPAGSCTELLLCADPNSTGSSDPSDPTAYQPSTPPATPSIANNQQPQTTFYSDEAKQPGCPLNESGDCWCKLGFKPMTSPIGDIQNKPATHGSGSIVQLKSTPNVQFNISPNPLPFGESAFNADASASYTASVTFTLPPFSPATQDLVDIAAGVHASRCTLSTGGTRFFILGKDFIDFSDPGSEPFNTQSDGNPALQAGQDCLNALGGYIDASDRAKRALKDAQELIQAYQSLPANTSFVKSHNTNPLGFCDVADNENHDPGFPQGNCLTQPIAQTINRYVDYYNNGRIPALNTAMRTLTARTAGLQQALSQIGNKITFLNQTRNDMVTVVNQQFFVGPIPVNITVDVGVFYGIEGDLFYRYTPFSALALADNTPAEMAAIGGELLPRVGAMLEIFAGVGFDLPGFAIKAGIAGDLTLVEVEANLQAGVGLAVATHPDLRPIPPPLDKIGTGALYFPTRKYEYFTDWFYDASVAVPEILAGEIDAKVKLKALFISKTFRKQLLKFGPAFSIASTRLLHGGGALSGLDLPVPGVASNSLQPFEMQEPMVQLQRLFVPLADPATTINLATLPSQLHYEGNCNSPPPS